MDTVYGMEDIQTKCLDLNKNLVFFWDRDRPALEFEDIGPAGDVDYCCAHCFWDGGGGHLGGGNGADVFGSKKVVSWEGIREM